MHNWEKLRPSTSDKIAYIISSVPAKRFVERELVPLCQEWKVGLSMPQRDITKATYYGFSGSPEERAQDIIEALKDPDVKALMVSGGRNVEEVIRVLEKYDKEHGLPKRGIPLLGFSNATMLQHYLGYKGIVSPVQAPDVGQLCSEKSTQMLRDLGSARYIQYKERLIKEYQGDEGHREAFIQKRIAEEIRVEEAIRNTYKALLFEGKLPEYRLRAVNEKARSCDKDVEGLLTVNDSVDGRAPYRILCDKKYGNIVAVEAGYRDSVVSTPQGFQAFISYLTSTGQISEIQAIILSICDADYKRMQLLSETDISKLEDLASSVPVPVFYGLPFGHGPIAFLPVPIHTDIRIHKTGAEHTITINPFMQKETSEALIKLYESRPPYAEALVSEKELTEVVIIQPVKLKCMTHPEAHTTKRQEVIFCRPSLRADKRGLEVPALEKVKTEGKNLMVQYNPPPVPEGMKPPKEEIDNMYVQNLQALLTEMLWMNKLKMAKSLTIVTDREMSQEVNLWLSGFAKDLFPETKLYTTVIPRENLTMELDKQVLKMDIKNIEIGQATVASEKAF